MTHVNDDAECFQCDDCGEEFISQESLDGHEAEGCWAKRDEGDAEES